MDVDGKMIDFLDHVADRLVVLVQRHGRRRADAVGDREPSSGDARPAAQVVEPRVLGDHLQVHVAAGDRRDAVVHGDSQFVGGGRVVAAVGHDQVAGGCAGRVDQLDAVAGTVHLGDDPDARVVDRADHVLKGFGVGEIDGGATAAAVGQHQLAQGSQPIAAAQAGKEGRRRLAENPAADDHAVLARAVQPEIDTRLRVERRGQRKRAFAGGQVGDHEPVAVRGDLDEQFIRLRGVDLFEDIAQRGFVVRRKQDVAGRSVAEFVIDVDRGGPNAVAVVEFVDVQTVEQPEHVLAVGHVGGHVDSAKP